MTFYSFLNIFYCNSGYSPLTHAIADLVDSFGLVSFTPLDIQDKQNVMDTVKEIDRILGYYPLDQHAHQDTNLYYADHRLT